MKIVFVQHPNNSRNFLFETPVDIKSGELLSVDTMSGTALATASAPSMDIADSSVADFAKFHGAYLPLKKVIGRYELKRFDEKPVEPKRKFKVGDKVRVISNISDGRLGNGMRVTHDMVDCAGKLFEIIEIDYESITGVMGGRHLLSGNGRYWCDELLEPVYEQPTVREVKRKAKVGEYIKVVDEKCTFGDYHNGGVYKCVCEETQSGTGRGVQINVVNSGYVDHDEYVVLESYTDEMYKAYLEGEAK